MICPQDCASVRPQQGGKQDEMDRRKQMHCTDLQPRRRALISTQQALHSNLMLISRLAPRWLCACMHVRMSDHTINSRGNT